MRSGAERRNENLTALLYQRGFRKTDILKLYRFIDWLMVLPEDLEKQCFEALQHFEEEQRMPYITTAERIGIEKGLKQGREEGREEGKLIGEILLAQRMLKLTIYDEDELQKKGLEELAQIAAQFEAKLNVMDASKS